MNKTKTNASAAHTLFRPMEVMLGDIWRRLYSVTFLLFWKCKIMYEIFVFIMCYIGFGILFLEFYIKELISVEFYKLDRN